MDQQLQQIRDQQRDAWNKSSPGWKKWDDLMTDFLHPMGDEIIRLLKPKDGDLALDVAAGTGEPGLTIARMIPTGKVVITDLAEGMLDITRQKAAAKGITNIETIACDVTNMPFADDTFDIISCRFGFMFFPDMLLAAKEMARVLKPGGKIATAVWGAPDSNFWVAAVLGVLNKNNLLMPPPPGSPGMFRCAKPGLIADIFSQAGLKHVKESDVEGSLNCKTTEAYWSFVSDVVGPVVAALSKADDALRATIKTQVYEVINQKYTQGNVAIEANAILIYGEK